MPRKQTADDIERELERFAQRLQQAENLPNINHYEPMPTQDLFHRTLVKNRILFGGNRSGKTYGGIADDVMILLRNHPFRNHLYADRPRRIRIIGTDFERHIGDAIVPLLAQLIPPSALIDASWERSYRKAEHKLTLADGSWCSLMSYEQSPSVFQSVSLDHVHFDEEPPKAIFDESIIRVLDTDGTWTMTETPVQQLEWVQDELVDPFDAGLRTDLDVFRVSTLDNTHLPADELQNMLANMTEQERAIRVAGAYLNSNLVFPEFERKAPYVVSLEAFVAAYRADPGAWAEPEGYPSIMSSMDYGLANPTAWLWHAAHRSGAIVTFAGLYQANVTIKEWAKRVKAMEAAIAKLLGLRPGWQPYARTGDPSIGHNNNGQTGITNQQAYALEGINIFTGGITGQRAGDQNVGLNKMREYMSRREIIPGVAPSPVTGSPLDPWWQIAHSTSVDWMFLLSPDMAASMAPAVGTTALIDELKKARRPRQSLNQKQEKNVSEQIRDKDNHAIDASKYYMMVKHDLRPATIIKRSTIATEMQEAMQENFGFTPAPLETHASMFTPIMNGNTPWASVHTGSLEE